MLSERDQNIPTIRVEMDTMTIHTLMKLLEIAQTTSRESK